MTANTTDLTTALRNAHEALMAAAWSLRDLYDTAEGDVKDRVFDKLNDGLFYQTSAGKEPMAFELGAVCWLTALKVDAFRARQK
jgi:hypothetical protein